MEVNGVGIKAIVQAQQGGVSNAHPAFDPAKRLSSGLRLCTAESRLQCSKK